MKDRFYWPQMTSEVEKYVKSCGRCMARKTLPQKRAPLSNITSSGPMELICIDFLSVEPDSKGVANVLVVTDHFTRYAQAYPAKDQKAVTVAKILLEKFFVYYGLPAHIHSDQGRDFESNLIKELLGMLGIKNQGQHLTTLRETHNLNDLIGHCSPCWVLWMLQKNTSGVSTSAN